MPTYAYVCKHCGHSMEAFQSIKEDPLKKCPQCKKHGLERQIGAGAGILFKGSGFYETDYRSESYKSGAKKESGAQTSGTFGSGAGSSGEKKSKGSDSGSSGGGGGSKSSSD